MSNGCDRFDIWYFLCQIDKGVVTLKDGEEYEDIRIFFREIRTAV